MAILKLFSEIVDSETKAFYEWDGIPATSSDDVVSFINEIDPGDTEISIHINCVGGMVFEGWRMYDALRQSGKKISAVVEGICASMATVILLAAPKERRFAYQNATFLIHDPAACYPSTGGYPDRLTADELEKMADKINIQAQSLREEEEKIVNLYVERTGTDADTLRAIMKDDTTITSSKAIELGFIDSTLAPNTDINKPMNKKDKKIEVENSWLNRLLAKAGFKSIESVKFNDLSFTAVDGTTFTVEREEGKYAIGDKASPDGSFVMEDGSTVTIKDGLIDAIIPAKMELKNPETNAVIDEEEAQHLLNTMHAKIKELEQENKDLATKSTDLATKNTDLESQLATANQAYDALTKSLPTEEQTEMLNIIDEAGGKAWFDVIIAKDSNGQPKTPQTNFGEDKDFGKDFINAIKAKGSRIRVK